MRKTKKQGLLATLCAAVALVCCMAIAAIMPKSATPVTAASTTVEMFDFSKELETSTNTLLGVNGITEKSSGVSSWGNKFWKNGLTIVQDTGSSGATTNLLRIRYFLQNGVVISKNGVKFTTPLAAGDVVNLKIKIYADLSSRDNWYQTAYGGVRLFSLDATGAKGEGYMVPADTQQRVWTTIDVDPAKIADANGNLTGLQIGCAHHESGANDTYLHADYTKSVFYIESVTAEIASNVEKDKGGLLDFTNDFEMTTATLAGVAGHMESSKGSGSVADWGNAFARKELKVDVMPGSNGNDTAVLKMAGFLHNGVAISTKGVKFATSIKADEVASVKISIYIDFSEASPYRTGYGGVRLFSLDATGVSGEGYTIPADTQQRSWTTITVDPAKIADANGNLTGLQFGSANHSSGANNTWLYADNSAYLCIESITVEMKPSMLRSVHAVMEDNIGMQFHYELAETVAANDAAYAKFTVADEEVIVPISEATLDAKGRYVFGYSLAAAEMTEEITVQMFHGDDTYGDTFTYSFAEYAMALLNDVDSTDELKAFVKATLNYGAYAQIYFNKNIDNLANAGLDEADKSIDIAEIENVVMEGSKPAEFKTFSFELSCESATELRLYFALADGVQIDDITITVNGAAVEPEVVGARYCLTVQGIAAAQLDDVITVVINDTTISLNAYAYFSLQQANADVNLSNLVKAMYLYGVFANAYFA